MTVGRKAHVLVGYSSAYPDALIAGVGTRLRVEARAPAYTGWLSCRDLSGTAAWVPEAWVEIVGSAAS